MILWIVGGAFAVYFTFILVFVVPPLIVGALVKVFTPKPKKRP